MKRLFAGVFFAVAASMPMVADNAAPAATANPPVAPGPGPRIQFASRVHEFGKIDAGQIAKHEFVFTNVGTATLEVLDVKPGCGCTTAGTWDKKVEPGKTGVIPLQFNSAGFGGSVTKSATVTCNDPSQSNIVLQLTATIWKAVDVTPQSAYFSLSEEKATNEVRSIRILNNLEQPLTLTVPEWTNKLFGIALKTVTPGKEYDLQVTAQPPFPTTYAQATVVLKTSSDKTPTISIPIYANIQPAVALYPSQIMLPPGALASPFQPTVTIRSTGPHSLVLSEPSTTVQGVDIKIKELQPGRVFNVTAAFPAGFKLAVNQQAELVLKSNHPKYPALRIPIVQPQPPQNFNAPQAVQRVKPLPTQPGTTTVPQVPLPTK